jgi:ABC-type Fe3+/spermidine/putrescine transport system ATPase subunit
MSRDGALPISISGVTKTYGKVHALDNVDLEIREGEFLTLLGPSGSGKTTLLMALAGFTRPDSGSIRFGDEEIILKPPHLRNVGMVFQSYALFPHMSVAANVGFPLKLRKVARGRHRQAGGRCTRHRTAGWLWRAAHQPAFRWPETTCGPGSRHRVQPAHPVDG